MGDMGTDPGRVYINGLDPEDPTDVGPSRGGMPRQSVNLNIKVV